MNIFKKLTTRNLKLNKKRTITTIIGIMLSTALICATFGLATSFQQSLLNDSIKSNGNYHATFQDITPEEQKYITENRKIDSYFKTQNLGLAKIEDIAEGTFNQYWYIKQYGEKALVNYGVQLVEGRLPQNENEILIQDRASDYTNKKYRIGDTISMKMGERYDNTGYKLNAKEEMLLSEDRTESLEEFRLTGEEKEYKIVGLMKRPPQEVESSFAPFLVCITYLPEEKMIGNVDISVKYKDVKNAYDITEEISKQGGENPYNYVNNSDMLRWLGVAKNDNINTTLYSAAIIVVIIIIFSSVFVIRNSFKIMITEKYRQYGMLASIGATSKQIRKNVLQEAFYLGLIAIPLGVLGSILAVFILVMLVQRLIGSYANIEFTFYFPWMAIVIGVILSILTIYLSSILPARKASKISPMEAIRANTQIKINSKKIRTPKWIKKIFKIGGQISYKNLKRSKKQYRTTVISIVVSITVFLALSSIINYVFGFTDIYYYENKGYNIVVSSDESEDEKILEQYNKIKNMEGIEQSSIQKMGYLSIGKQYINEEVGNYYGSGTKDNEIILPIIAIENIHFEELTKKLGITKEQVGGILADHTYYYKNGKYTQNNQFKIKEGETIQGYIETPHQLGNKENNENDKTSTEIKIIKRLGEEETIGIGKYTNGIIVSEEYLEKNIKQYAVSNLYIKAENPDEFSKLLDNIEDINYTNYNESIKENRAMITVINIFVYGFITVITLIGVTNIFNTITTNMMLRSKEFAMLKSIGMTRKEFNSMIRLESIFYGLKSLIIGLPIGLGLSYVLYKSFNVSMEMQYSIPWIPIGISALFVFIIVFITMKYSLNKINKQNIIETIRNDNI